MNDQEKPQADGLATLLGGHPSLKIAPLLDIAKYDIGDILKKKRATN